MRGMICLHPITALPLWRLASRGIVPMPESNSARDIRGVDARIEPIHELPSQLLEDEGTVHLMVSNKDRRTQSPQTHCHLFTDKDLPAESFYLWRDNVLVPSPELCFCIMARHLGRTELLRLGMELCGHYRRADSKTSYELEQLTCTGKLCHFLERMPKVRGIGVAREAASRLIDHSNSPRETLIALMCSLPAQSGGFQLPKPVMNQTIDLPDGAKTIAGQGSAAGDIFWEKHALIIEYDSDEFHSNRRARDLERRNGIEAAGIHVITITNGIASDYERLTSSLSVAHDLIRARKTNATPRVDALRHKLYHELSCFSHYTC